MLQRGKVMRKGEAESCNTDLRQGEGGFHCGDLWRPEYSQRSLERKKRGRKEMPKQRHKPFFILFFNYSLQSILFCISFRHTV